MAVTVTQVRRLVNDLEAPQTFDDAHYEDILSYETNIYRAAAIAARTFAAYYAEKVEAKAGPVSIKNQQKYEHYSALADDYDQRAREGGGFGADEAAVPILTGSSISDIEAAREDADRYQSAFYRGQFDNPNTGEEVE